MQYGHKELAGNLPELPLGGMMAENNQISITAPGSSQQLPPEVPPQIEWKRKWKMIKKTLRLLRVFTMKS